MVTENPLPTGSRCRFEIRLGTAGPRLEGAGEVAHRREPEPGVPGGMGIRFLTLAQEGAALLARLTEAYEKRGADGLESALADEVGGWERRRLEDESTEPLGPPEEVPPPTDRLTPALLPGAGGSEEAADDEDRVQPGKVESDALDDTVPLTAPALENGEVEETVRKPSSFDREGEAPASTPEPVDGSEAARSQEDTLDLTLEVAPTSGPAPRGRSSTPRWILAAALAAFLGGGWLLWANRAEFPWPELVASEELPGWEDRQPYEITEAAGADVPDAARGAAAAALALPDLASDPSTASPDPAARPPSPPGESELDEPGAGGRGEPAAPFRSVREIRWFPEGDGLRVELQLDGAIPEKSFRTFRPAKAPPRIVVQLFGVDDPYPIEELGVRSALVRSIRVGFHAEQTRPEQRVVLDLTGPDVQLESVEPNGDVLVVRLSG